MTNDRPIELARAWARAFNDHDVDAILALYADDATHTSPKVRALHPETGGVLIGKAAIGAWWRAAIARTPGLRYEERAVTASAERVVLEYTRFANGQPAMEVAEVFDVREGRVVASRVYHG